MDFNIFGQISKIVGRQITNISKKVTRAVKVAANYMLVGNPDINIKGAPIGTLVCYALICVLNLICINRVLVSRPSYAQLFLKPLLATAGMAVTAKVSYNFLCAPLGNSLATLGAIALAAAVYGVLVLALRIITKEDLEMLPKGEKLAKILRVR